MILYNVMVLDLITIREKLEEYDNLTVPIPTHEEIDAISKSLQFHLQPDIPENIQRDARILQQKWVDIHNEFLAFLELGGR